MSKGTPLCGSWAHCSLDMLLFDGFLPSVGVSAALALGGVIKGSSSGLSQWQWAQQGEHPGLEKAKTTWLPHVQAHMVSRCEHHSCFVILQIMVVSVVVSALLRWCCAPWPPAPVFRASWCCWWCHGLGCVPPLPLKQREQLLWAPGSQAGADVEDGGVHSWVCKPWSAPGLWLSLQPLFCPLEKKRSCKGGRVTPLSWPTGRTVDQDLLMLFCFQEEL